MKRIVALHATPLDEETVVFGKIPIVNSDWDGPIAVFIRYDNDTTITRFVTPEEYKALCEDMQTGRLI